MFGFHILFAIVFVFSGAVFAASDLDSVELISTAQLDGKRPAGWGGYVRDTLATFQTMSQLGYKNAILAQLGSPELSKYFPNVAERDAIATQIEGQVRATMSRYGTGSPSLIRGIRVATEETTKRIMERIFQSEAINDSNRSALWSEKILAPVRGCLARANNSDQARDCQARAAADMKANVGLAVAHQTARKHMTATIASENATSYRKCIQIANARPLDCTMSAIRSGAETLIRQEYTKRQNAQLPGHSVDLSQPHLPALRACLAAGSSRADFLRCGDQLTLNAGPEIARARAFAQQEIRDNVPAASLPAVADVAAQTFTACANGNLANNVRDEDGALSTSNCEQRVRQAVGHKMRDVILDPQFEENSKGSKPEDTGLTQAQLDKRKTQMLGEHRTCIDKIPSDATADTELLRCFQKSGREIAEFLGDNRFRAQLAKHLKGMSESDRAQLHTQLMTDYRTCLGGAGDRPGIQSCAATAARHLAHKIGTTRLRSDLALAIGTDGVTASNQRISQIEAAYRQCLESKKDFVTLEKELEKCGLDLKTAGTRFVQERARAALLQSGDSRQVTALKNDLINNIDRVSGLMPQGPVGQGASRNGALAPAMAELNNVIRYNPAAADRSLRQVLGEAGRAGATRESVANQMLQSGTVDQMIKASAFQKIVAKMNSLRGEQRPSEQALKTLTSKENFEKIFSPQVMSLLRRKVANDMTALTGSNLSAAAVRAAKDRIEKEVKEILMQSDRFGRLYARDRIQAGIASTYHARLNSARRQWGGLADMFAPEMPRLGNSRQARRAEDRFIDLLLRPTLIDNRVLTPQQIAAAKGDVTRHVQAALDGREISDGRRQVAGRTETGVQ